MKLSIDLSQQEIETAIAKYVEEHIQAGYRYKLDNGQINFTVRTDSKIMATIAFDVEEKPAK